MASEQNKWLDFSGHARPVRQWQDFAPNQSETEQVCRRRSWPGEKMDALGRAPLCVCNKSSAAT